MFTPPSSSRSESGTHLPLRPALRAEDEGPCSPKSGPVKVVSIAEPEESPLSTPPGIATGIEESSRIKQFPASVSARRLTGRPIMPSNSSSRLSLVSQSSLDDYDTPLSMKENHLKGGEKRENGEGKGERKGVGRGHDKLLMQVSEWLQREKAKRAAKKAHKQGHGQRNDGIQTQEDREGESTTTTPSMTSRTRTSSQSSGSSAFSLERLQRILEDNMGAFGHESLPTTSPYLGPRRPSHLGRRRPSSVRKMGSSDTEYQDGDVVVPSCDVVLDNSKTLSYSGGGTESSSETVTLSTSKRAEKERAAWKVFKTEIVTLAHTLRLKGWRRVPLENGGEIEVERLSGALTNAVYVVSPPRELPLGNKENGAEKQRYKPPPKLLLRIYGPQVEHLIDRENELGILRRLARKKIGPRLLGTFTNGRFEEFFNAQTLTADDLRVQDTSKQIAKRMRELHDGIDLLEREREEGPFVWQNWDKWVGRCEEVISYLDREILSGKKGRESWRSRGLVCGVEWKFFKSTVDKYRRWLEEFYKNVGGVGPRLVFAHNDTQYGNILRLLPPPPTPHTPPSPLLLPQNTHKQLVVIDFEYASANTPGLEFANHFTEWCYDYHSKSSPFACNTAKYPTLEEQKRFIRSYVNHRPQFNPRASATPKMNAMDGLAKGSISEFLLDSRMPGGASSTSLNEGVAAYAEDEARREREVEMKVEELLREVRIWRVANSAQWVAWGIVQADVPGLDGKGEEDSTSSTPPHSSTTILPNSDGSITEEPDKIANGNVPHHDEDLKGTNRLARQHLDAEVQPAQGENENGDGEETEEEEFDYLGYARERALFFWGDVVSLGLVSKEELLRMGGEEGERLVAGLKVVDF